MKILKLFLLLCPMQLLANDSFLEILSETIAPIDQWTVHDARFHYDGEQLDQAISLMLKREILLRYIGTDHDSEQGVCLKSALKNAFRNDDSAPHDTIMGHCGGIFDGQDNNAPMSNHDSQHAQDVLKIKHFAVYECNKNTNLGQIYVPVFTSPANLVDIVYGLSSSLRHYHLSEGASFHCITPPTAHSSVSTSR